MFLVPLLLSGSLEGGAGEFRIHNCYEMALELVCRTDLSCKRHCRTSPVVLDRFGLWPNLAECCSVRSRPLRWVTGISFCRKLRVTDEGPGQPPTSLRSSLEGLHAPSGCPGARGLPGPARPGPAWPGPARPGPALKKHSKRSPLKRTPHRRVSCP